MYLLRLINCLLDDDLKAISRVPEVVFFTAHLVAPGATRATSGKACKVSTA